MNKLLIALALGVALTACKKEDAAAPATDAAAPAAASAPAIPANHPVLGTPAADAAAAPAAADATAAAAPANSGLPKECEDYLNRTKACFAKAGGNAAAAAFQQGIDQTKSQWEAMADKSGLGAACKAANDAFAQTAAALKCE
jgi:hypothetical protein